LNRESCPQYGTVFLSSAEIQQKLNGLSSDLFPVASNQNAIVPTHSHTCANNLLKFILTPVANQGFDYTESNVFNDPCPIMPHIDHNELVELHTSHWDPIIKELTDRELEISFLGTGAAMPSKYRNVSGIYIHLFDRGGIILDCGEGTLGQLYRLYGDETENILKNLRMIWISHLHADHHLGMAKLMTLRQKLSPKEKIIIVGPDILIKFLTEFSSCYGEPLEFDSISNLHEEELPKFYIDALIQMNVQLTVVPVDHSCKHSYGVIVKYGRIPIIYSGDTRPCKNLADIKDCAILIHEATFEVTLFQYFSFANRMN
jgi:ribonuclease BN (tRNA processing enzyme)